jgi:hypothetical protein
MNNRSLHGTKNISFLKRIVVPCFIILFFISFVACSNEKKITVPQSEIKSLPGYVVKDSNFSRKDFNVWVITTSLSFDSILSAVDTSVKKPSFDKDIVLAMKAATATNTYRVTYNRMVMQGTTLNVYFDVEKDKPTKDDFGWVSMQTISRDKQVRRVKFYYGDVLVRSVPVVIVY